MSAGIVAVAALLGLLLQIVLAQRTERPVADKGPRATGLLALAPNGKAHLIPITIMVDGEFYDAAAYKASPVPLALDTGTVYEAVRTGVSQGLFTVKGATTGGQTWLGQGTWESDAEIKAEAAKKKAAAAAAKSAKKKSDEDEEGGPPRLRRGGAAKAAPDISGSDKSKPAASSSPSVASSSTSPSSNSTSAAASESSAQEPSPSPSSDEDDPNRPHLRREKTHPEKIETETIEKPISGFRPAAKGTAVAASSVNSPSGIQLIPAVSDAGGPEPRSYAFDMKPDESRQFRTKMLALAASDVEARADRQRSEMAVTAPRRPPARKVKAAKAAGPTFEDVQIRAFDLSNSNEAVLVLTAKAHMQGPRSADDAALPASCYVTLVAREDIYGELHKALSNVTDDAHLDVLPRLELIDAVDVDGDGRGELLFRRVSDAGSAYVVYRVIGNQLWPLFQGSIG